MAELEKVNDTADLERQIDELQTWIWELRDVAESADPHALRRVLTELVARVRVRFGTERTGRYSSYPVLGGVIEVRDPVISVTKAGSGAG